MVRVRNQKPNIIGERKIQIDIEKERKFNTEENKQRYK